MIQHQKPENFDDKQNENIYVEKETKIKEQILDNKQTIVNETKQNDDQIIHSLPSINNQQHQSIQTQQNDVIYNTNPNNVIYPINNSENGINSITIQRSKKEKKRKRNERKEKRKEEQAYKQSQYEIKVEEKFRRSQMIENGLLQSIEKTKENGEDQNSSQNSSDLQNTNLTKQNLN